MKFPWIHIPERQWLYLQNFLGFIFHKDNGFIYAVSLHSYSRTKIVLFMKFNWIHIPERQWFNVKWSVIIKPLYFHY